MGGKIMLKCSFEHAIASKLVTKHVLSGIAASIIFLSRTHQVVAADLSHQSNICQLATVLDGTPTIPLDEGSDKRGGKLMMMRGMTARISTPLDIREDGLKLLHAKVDLRDKGKKTVTILRVYIHMIWRHPLSKSIHFVFMEGPMDILPALEEMFNVFQRKIWIKMRVN